VVIVARVLAFIVGTAIVTGTVASAVKTVVMPRAEPVLLTRWVFVSLRKPFDWAVHKQDDWNDADRIMARFAPFAMVLLPGVWVIVTIFGFIPVYWALGVDVPRDAFIQSGSSLLTLGFAFDHHGPTVAVTFLEATLGLGLVALLISFLPTIYQQFSRREVLVSQLDTRAGTPPSPLALFRRAERIGWVDQLDDLWLDWERWFVEIEESHTSYPALPFFRSPRAERSWITAAGAVLDSAALRASTLDQPRSWQAQLCLRSGYLALRSIAGVYDIEFEPDPQPDDAISVTREEFDAVVDDLLAVGVRVKDDRDQAWRDFSGWRVNYDGPLLALCGLVMAPMAPWSSDRSVHYRQRLLNGRLRNGRIGSVQRARRWRHVQRRAAGPGVTNDPLVDLGPAGGGPAGGGDGDGGVR
jgi:hypothetical protein